MQLRDRYSVFQRYNAAILAISGEDQVHAARLKTELGLPFLLLADPERQVIQRYGVFHENEPKGRLIARPAIFVIDAAGIIRYRYIGATADDRPDVGTILGMLEEIQGTG